MNDLVEVTGHYRGTPLLRFVQKGRGVTSLTGEKLYEGQVIDAVQAVLRRRGLAPGFFLFVADEERSCYRLYLEPGGSLAAPHRSAHAATTGDASEPSTASIAWEIDTQLSTVNMEYRGKRESGRLAPLVVARLRPGAGDAYKAACVTAGQREGQFKPALLHYRKQLAFPVESYVQP
jgi:hypothetical protein